jgi:hypothetical protein
LAHKQSILQWRVHSRNSSHMGMVRKHRSRFQ